MIEKIETLLDLAAEALSLYIRKTQKELGEALPLKPATALHDYPPVSDAPLAKPRRIRKPIQDAPVSEMSTSQPSPQPAPAGLVDPFETSAAWRHEPKTDAPKIPAEEVVEAARRCQEVIGLFIKRYLTAQPSGLQRAMALIKNICPGEQGKKIPQFAYESHAALIPAFEAELEKADAGR